MKLSLLWKVLLSISLSLTLLFGITGWLVQNHAIRTTTSSLEEEVQSSLSAYESLWRARKDELASVSLILSTMSDVRAAFSTGDQATIRDSAGELWSKISGRVAIFLVTDPRGMVIASLAGQPGAGQSANAALGGRLDEVQAVSASFPNQSSGVLVRGGRLYQIVITPVYVQSPTGPGLIDVLVAGFAIDSEFAKELKTSTGGSDFVFRAGGRTAATTLASETFPPDTLARVAQLKDVRGQAVGELHILRSFAAAQQRISELRRQITIVWALAVGAGLGLTWLMFASIRSAREELVRQERIFTIGRLATSIVHDLRNPLAAIYGGAEMLVDQELPPESVKRLAGNMYRSSRQIQEMLEDLVDISRGKPPTMEICRLADVVEAACHSMPHEKVEIHHEIPGDIELPLERARMERVFANLLGNAVEAMPAGGEIHIRASRQDNSIVVEVEDTGPGISGAIQSRLFEPFASMGKKNGLGLGLALARQTLQAHGGEIWSEPKAAPGARFCLRLPC
jgi:signal transduction histidine kinase